MKWGTRAFLKSFFYEIATAGRSTSSNLEALGLVLEQDFIWIIACDHILKTKCRVGESNHADEDCLSLAQAPLYPS
jgi:hypothetical protein